MNERCLAALELGLLLASSRRHHERLRVCLRVSTWPLSLTHVAEHERGCMLSFVQARLVHAWRVEQAHQSRQLALPQELLPPGARVGLRNQNINRLPCALSRIILV